MEEQKVHGDGVVTGYGLVDGRKVFVFAQDFTVFGGSLSGAYAAEDLQGHGPGHEGGRAGHRPQRLGRRAHSGRRRVARRLRRHLSPQHARERRRPADHRHHGPLRRRRRLLARHHRLHPDGRQDGYMFITGPDVIKAVTHEEVTKEELGGAHTHNERAAWPLPVPHDDAECLARCASCSALFRRTTSRTRRANLAPTPSTAPTRSSTRSSPTSRTARTT